MSFTLPYDNVGETTTCIITGFVSRLTGQSDSTTKTTLMDEFNQFTVDMCATTPRNVIIHLDVSNSTRIATMIVNQDIIDRLKKAPKK